MSVTRRWAGVAVLIVTSVAFGLFTAGTHAHGLPEIHSHDRTVDACADESTISAVCKVCTLAKGSAAPAANGPEHHLPAARRCHGPFSATLPDDPFRCIHASRAPPASHALEA